MGGRGAISSNNTKSQFAKFKNVKTQEKNDNLSNIAKLNNKKSLFDFVKKQVNIDLSTIEEENTRRSRTYAGVHLESLNRNDRNAVISLLNGKNMRIEDNGGYGYAILYKK